MSIQSQTHFQAAEALPHRIVLRFAELFPSALGGFEMHAKRKGGDRDHVDEERSGRNLLLIGKPTWKQDLLETIALARAQNLAEELEAMKRRKRRKEIEARRRDGLQDPWRDSAGGPLREVILTAHRRWFANTGIDAADRNARAARFEEQAVSWLKSRFGDAVLHARADHDELTYHIHAIVAPWVEKTTDRRGRQRLLQPSSHALLKSYEAAQDDVGEHFTAIGLQRGKRTAASRRAVIGKVRERESERAARKANAQPIPPQMTKECDPTVPTARKHVPTPQWWAEEKGRLLRRGLAQEIENARLVGQAKIQAQAVADLDARETALTNGEKDAATVVELVEAIATGAPKEEVQAKIGNGPLSKRLIAALRVVQSKMISTAQRSAEKAVAEERFAFRP